jgi:hypothetical protein
MESTIKVWRNNDGDAPMYLALSDVLEAFSTSFYAQPKKYMDVPTRVHLFIEHQYRCTFVSPFSRDANGDPSMSEDAYARLLEAASGLIAQ